MSQFLVVKDLNFDNIMICFDNSSNELEYTTYNYSNQEMISKMEDCFNDFVEKLENDDNFEEIYASLKYRLFFNNQEEEKVLIKITDDEWISANVYIYTYKEHDGGVHEITADSQNDIYQSRFDDYKNTMMQVLGGYINTEHIFEIEE